MGRPQRTKMATRRDEFTSDFVPSANSAYQNTPQHANKNAPQHESQQGYQNAPHQGLLQHIECPHELQQSQEAWLLQDPKHPQIYSIVQNPSSRVKALLITSLIGAIMILISFVAINPSSMYRQKGGKMLSGASIQPYFWYVFIYFSKLV